MKLSRALLLHRLSHMDGASATPVPPSAPLTILLGILVSPAVPRATLCSVGDTPSDIVCFSNMHTRQGSLGEFHAHKIYRRLQGLTSGHTEWAGGNSCPVCCKKHLVISIHLPMHNYVPLFPEKLGKSVLTTCLSTCVACPEHPTE